MFFDSWGDLLRVIAVGAPAYAALVLLLRLSGKRTLSKMNAFDFVITVAMGSTLATILLSADVSLAEGVVALALLVLLQFLITWSSVRWTAIRRLVKSTPTLLYYRGDLIEAALRKERVTEDEVLAAVRAHGYAGLEAVDAVILETDGTIAALEADASGDVSALQRVRHFPGRS